MYWEGIEFRDLDERDAWLCTHGYEFGRDEDGELFQHPILLELRWYPTGYWSGFLWSYESAEREVSPRNR